jgi:16S rRNA (guanine1207-N2)-methyltransferase
MVALQTFKPRASSYEQNGFRVVETAEPGCDLVIVVPERQREQSLADMAQALELVREGGVVIVAIHNDWGSRRHQDYLQSVAGPCEVQTKKHCRVFWLRKSVVHEPTLAEWKQAGMLQRGIDGQWWTKPGLFSWKKVDQGSELLIRELPTTLSGAVADLGGGWGYLSAAALAKCPDIDLLHLFEADRVGVEAARRNIGNVKAWARAQCLWADVTQGVEQRRYDFVIMNPPFHEGRAAEPLLGMKFIAAAALALKPQGELWMVSNRHLPYEEVLEDAFGSWEKVVEEEAFKVLHARSPQIGSRLTRDRKGKWRR